MSENIVQDLEKWLNNRGFSLEEMQYTYGRWVVEFKPAPPPPALSVHITDGMGSNPFGVTSLALAAVPCQSNRARVAPPTTPYPT